MEPMECIRFLETANPEMLIAVGLDRYQNEVLGKGLMNCGDVVSICESLRKHQDVMVKNKGNCIQIVEIRRRVKDREDSPLAREPIAYLNGEYRLRDWQKEVLEADQARTGCLFGDAG